jgi:serine phosphatase RsbU (regulator of sigma subunit)
VAVVVADLVVGQNVVLGLVVVAPLLAANLAGPRLTAGYGVLAFLAAVLLGIADGVYVPGDAMRAQEIRLAGIAVMGVVSVLLSRYRIERERRLAQVTKVAEAAQRTILLPVPEQLGPVRVAVIYESAASDALVGGDLYGFVVTSHGLRILVGDVRGKGLDAVRMSAQVLATFRERANDDHELPILVERLDATVAKAAETDEDFATAVLVQLTNDGQVTIANAGHPAPILLSKAGSRRLDPDPPCPPLGLGGAGNSLTLTVTPSDRLLLYTDGLTEARDPATRTFYSTEQITKAVGGAEPVAQALSRLRQGVVQWSGGVLHDDIALVLLEYQP